MNILAFALAAAATSAPQEPQPAPVDLAALQASFERGQDLCAVRWRVADDGQVFAEIQRSEFARGEQPLFPYSMPVANLLGVWFLHGPDDAMVTADLERHLRRVGVATRTEELRQYVLATDPQSIENPALRWRAQLDRIAAVRLLQQRGANTAVGELRTIVANADDPALRDAARQVVAEIERSPSPVVRTPFDFARAVPADADLLLFVDQSRLPRLHALHRAIRNLALTKILAPNLEGLRPRGGNAPAAEIAQRTIDRFGEMPFELVRQFGHVRVDSFVLALQAGTMPVSLEKAQWVANAAGAFDVARIAATAEQAIDGGRVELDCKPLPLQLAFTAHELRATGKSRWSTTENADVDALRAQGFGAHAVSVWLPEGARLEFAAPWPPLGAGTIAIDFVPRFVLDAEFAPLIGEAPETLVPKWNEWLGVLRAELARARAGDAPAWLQSSRALADAVDALTPKVDGGVLRMHLEGDFDAASLVAMLRVLGERGPDARAAGARAR